MSTSSGPPPGHPVPDPAEPSPAAGGAGRRTTPTWLWPASIALLAVAIIAAALIIAADNDNSTAPTTSSSTTAPATTSSTTSTSTAPPTSAPPTTTPLPQPTPSPSDTPLAAAGGWAADQGLDFLGACGDLDSTVDYGPDPWCAILWEDRGAEVVYRVADFPGGDFGYWLLVYTTELGWFVQDAAEDLTGSPPF